MLLTQLNIKDKRDKAIVVLSILFIFSLSGYFYLTISQKDSNNENDVLSETSESKEPIQERVIPHNLRLTIIKPEDTFKASEPRMFSALAEGNGKYADRIRCRWEFFLNEGREDGYYKIMDNMGILAGETKEVCAFTSSFIDAPGSLRVKLTMVVFDSVNENIETVEAEKMFTVI